MYKIIDNRYLFNATVLKLINETISIIYLPKYIKYDDLDGDELALE